MNNEENKNINTQTTSEPEVLGELRKEKIGKPMIVIEIAILIIIVVVALPIVNSALHDENSTFYQILHGRVDTPDDPEEDDGNEVKDGFELQTLNNSTIMQANSLRLKNFSFNGNEIKLTMYCFTGILDLDEEAYYLEIYSSSDSMLGHVKLTGSYDSAEKQVTLTANGLNFNTAITYLGKVVIMKDSDYPSITLSTDESGMGSLKCIKGTRTIEYLFQNNYLSEIRDNESISRQGKSDEAYLELLEDYRNKADAIKGMNSENTASVEESSTGLTFVCNIVLHENDTYSEDYKDNSYYLYNTEAKVIHYAEEGKGFDCE